MGPAARQRSVRWEATPACEGWPSPARRRWRTSAPALETLWLTNRVVPDLDVLTALGDSPQFQAFLWDAPDESQVRVGAATRAAARPPADRVRLRHLWNG